MKTTEAKGSVFIGCSGFSESLWKGFFYPEDLASKDFLQFYSRKLNTVEINSTFYHRPRSSTVQKWYDETPDDFKFFIKVHKYFTNTKRLLDCLDDLEVFRSNISNILKDKLAGFLFQMPPSFKFSDENLDRVLKIENPDYLNVTEFRDNSWWNEEISGKLQEKNIIFSGVSIPKNIPDDVIINNQNLLYYRLHGVPQLFKSEYSESFLNELAKEINRFTGTKFIYFNNTFGTAGIKNALYLSKILK